MNRIFPSMNSKPENRRIFSLIPCWGWSFIVLPLFMPILGIGLWEEWELSVWLEIGYHVTNTIIVLFVIFNYIKEEWLMFSTDVGYYFKHAILTAGLIVITELLLLGTLYRFGFNIIYMFESLPFVEMFISHTPLFLIELEPIFGTIVLTIFTPISITALFYCLGFAPICCKKPWLAYICVAVLTLLPPIINIIWRGDAFLFLCGYFVQLPVHLLSCWSYQKTDNVFTPFLSLAITNLLTSVALIIVMRFTV